MPASTDSNSVMIVASVLTVLGLAAGCSGSDGAERDDGGSPPDDARAEVAPDGLETTDGAETSPEDVEPDATPDVGDASGDSGEDAELDGGPEGEADVPETTMRFFFGNFHSHTGVWEGVGTPAENFAWARDVAGFDFYAVTDHAEFITSAAWDETGAAADAANEDGVFVALRGFEWSHPLIGHSCAFWTDTRTSAVTDYLLSQYYDWVDTNDALAQFNHPGREWSNFNNLEYVARVADNFFAIEVANKGDSIAEGEYLAYFAQALDNGWYLAPTSNQDNHEQSTNCHRSVFVAPELSRAALREAMVARRIYATDDPNLEITFKVGDAWMGSRLPTPAGPVIFTVRVVDDEEITRLELVTNGGRVEAAFAPPAGSTDVSWEPEVSVAAGRWYYVKVTEADVLDGEPPQQTAVSAPIWFD